MKALAKVNLAIFLLLAALLTSAHSPAELRRNQFVWMAKKYNTDKVYVITDTFELPDDMKVKDARLRFKNAVFRKFGKDPKGDIAIENCSPKLNETAVERSRKNQVAKMRAKGWEVLELNRFGHSLR